MAKMKTYSGPAALAAAKKSGLNIRKASGFAAFEKMDKASDKKADLKKDKKAGLKMRGGGCVSRMK